MGLPAAALMAPPTLGRYQILSELGQGAMGTVYKAIDPLIERTVAIKTINLGVSKDEFREFEERFYREARSAGRLNHPNIVTIFDIGNSGNVAWIAMELLEGRSLRQVIDSGAVLPVEKIAEVGAQVAEGLAAAHAAQVIHRDIKPANIMILPNGLAKITDFGVALIPATSRTLDGVIIGSPRYMSPEHVVGQSIDGRSDIFSLGAVLYELLTGRPPFTADHVGALMYKVLNEMPPPPSSIFKSVPIGLDYIVAKAMAKHPDDRYANAALMAADLRRYRKLPPPQPSAEKPRTLERRRAKRATSAEPTLDQQTVIEELVPRRKSSRPDRADDDEIIDITAPRGLDAAARGKPGGAPTAGRWRALATALAVIAVGAAAYFVLTPAPVPRPAAAPPPAASSVPAPAAAPVAEPPPELRPAPEPPSRGADAVLAAAPPAAKVAPPTATRRDARADAPPARPAGNARATPPVVDANAPTAATAQVGTGQIEFAVSPWGEIYVDGKRQGITPPDSQFSLPAGTHRIEIRNGDFPPHVQTVEIKAGQSLKLRHRFAQ